MRDKLNALSKSIIDTIAFLLQLYKILSYRSEARFYHVLDSARTGI